MWCPDLSPVVSTYPSHRSQLCPSAPSNPSAAPYLLPVLPGIAASFTSFHSQFSQCSQFAQFPPFLPSSASSSPPVVPVPPSVLHLSPFQYSQFDQAQFNQDLLMDRPGVSKSPLISMGRPDVPKFLVIKMPILSPELPDLGLKMEIFGLT